MNRIMKEKHYLTTLLYKLNGLNANIPKASTIANHELYKRDGKWYSKVLDNLIG